MLIFKDWLVYRMQSPLTGRVAIDSELAGYFDDITEVTVQTLFGRDASNRNRFARLVKNGGTGVVIRDDEQWLAYGWIANDAGSAPSHLPASLITRSGRWIHACHTREGYRGKGLYKRLLIRLTSNQGGVDGDSPDVFIDAAPDNVPAIRAIRAVGFEEDGRIRVLYVRRPRVRIPVYVRWFRTERHPRIGSNG
jgi:RimJ/RimL family protein N-acetyltransferase